MKQASFYAKFVFWLSSALVVLGLSACRHSSEERIDTMAEMVSGKLQFNDAQMLLWENIVNDVKTIKAGMDQEHQDVRDTIASELKSDQLDEDKFYRALELHQVTVSSAFATILPKLTQLHASLSGEQKEVLTAFLAKKHRRGHHFP